MKIYRLQTRYNQINGAAYLKLAYNCDVCDYCGAEITDPQFSLAIIEEHGCESVVDQLPHPFDNKDQLYAFANESGEFMFCVAEDWTDICLQKMLREAYSQSPYVSFYELLWKKRLETADSLLRSGQYTINNLGIKA